MRRRSLLLCGALAILVCGCGAHTAAQASAAVRVRIGLLGFSPDHPKEFFTLTCHPTGGTLPFAARVCADIDRYPAAMLHPSNYLGCIGDLGAPLTIWTTVHGVTSQSVSCASNSGVKFEVYVSAAEHSSSILTYWEQWLPCDCMPGGPQPSGNI